MILSVISDLQMEDRSDSDEFRGNEEALHAFLITVPDHSIILLGDIFERGLHGEAYGDLIDLLMRKTFRYVAGNHDLHMLNSSFAPASFKGVPVVEKLVIGDTLFFHGHQLDPVNASRDALLGLDLSNLADWMADHISANINRIARELEKDLNSLGRNSDPNAMMGKALDCIEHLEVNGRRINRVVFGHTHQAGRATRNDRFEAINTGCWILGKHDVTEIEIDGN